MVMKMMGCQAMLNAMAFNAKFAVDPPMDIHTVRVRVNLQTSLAENENQQISAELKKSDFITLVEPQSVFDCRIVGFQTSKGCRFRLLDWQGNQASLPTTDSPVQAIDDVLGRLEAVHLLKILSYITQPAPPFKVVLKVKNRASPIFRLGESPIFQIISDRDCHILLINLDEFGRATLLFPSALRHHANHQKALRSYEIPGTADRFGFTISTTGRDIIKVLAMTEPMDLSAIQSLSNATALKGSRAIRAYKKSLLRSLLANTLSWSEDALVLFSEKWIDN